MTTQSDTSIQAIRDEVLRKIGRNVVLFQRLESILKLLASAQRPSMPLSKAKAALEKGALSTDVKTLGQVAGQVVEELFSTGHPDSFTPTEISEPWLAMSFRIPLDTSEIEESRRTLKALIDERNALVHHLLSRWNPHDSSSCSTLSVELDEQRRRIIVEIEKYSAHANTVRDLAAGMKAFVESETGKRDFDLMFLRSSRVAMLLAQIASTHAREDGWTLLSVADEQLSSLVPQQFSELKREHGDGSLQNLVAAIDLFDIQAEVTPSGGTRVVYRTRT